MLATLVSFDGIFRGEMYLRFNDKVCVRLLSYADGRMVIVPVGGTFITDFVEAVCGCFLEGSNLYGLRVIEFDFNGARILVNADNAAKEEVLRLWNAEINALAEKAQRKEA